MPTSGCPAGCGARRLRAGAPPSTSAAPPGRRPLSVRAQANPRRGARVSQQILREVSLLMAHDVRVRRTMSPEERLGADASVSTVASVTDVVLSADLAVAKVYVSFFGDQRGAQLAFSGLQARRAGVAARVNGGVAQAAAQVEALRGCERRRLALRSPHAAAAPAAQRRPDRCPSFGCRVMERC